MNAEKMYPKGSRLHHKIYGYGRVVGVKDGKIVVQFDDGKNKKLDAEICIKNVSGT